jgi:hypothetical protein
MCMLARVALRRGELAAVHDWAARAHATATTAGGRVLERMPLHLEAVAARMSGRVEASRALYLASITLNDELGETRMAALECRNLAYLELQAGEPDRALELFAESRQRLEGSDTSGFSPYLIFDEATVAAIQGDVTAAAAKLAEAEDAFRTAGVVPDPDDAAEIERLRARVRGAAGPHSH